MSDSIVIGPPELGFELGTDVAGEEGWSVRALKVPDRLDGPPGILQGGLAAGVTAAIAGAAGHLGAPSTRVAARLHAPTPLATMARARSRAVDGIDRCEVEVRHDGGLLISAEVSAVGHDPAPEGLDLLELASVAIPDPVPQQEYPTCFVCGPTPAHPRGLRLHPRPGPADTIVQPWIADGSLAGERPGVVDPLVVAAVLDCPTVWSGIDLLRDAGYLGALLAGFHLRCLRDLPVGAPLRIVARCDGLDGRKLRARAAVVDDAGCLYALVSALHIAVVELPSVPRR